MFPLDLVDSTDEEIERLVEVRDGSFATELVKVDAGTCPLRSESDLILRRSEMTRCAISRHRTSGPLKNQKAVN